MAIKRTEFSLAALKKAATSLKVATQSSPKNDLERDGVIQRFEYTFELAWKSLKRYIEINSGPTEYNVKDLFREAGRQGLIESVENWFSYLEARNLTSHTYDHATAEKTYAVAKDFSPDVFKLIDALEKKNARAD